MAPGATARIGEAKTGLLPSFVLANSRLYIQWLAFLEAFETARMTFYFVTMDPGLASFVSPRPGSQRSLDNSL